MIKIENRLSYQIDKYMFIFIEKSYIPFPNSPYGSSCVYMKKTLVNQI